jgi:hypothetical protein
MASLGQGWLGGLSYFRNLFAALRELEAPALSPVIITRPQTETRQLESFQPIEVLYSSLVDTQTPWWKLRRASQLYLDRDVLFERFLKRNRIDLSRTPATSGATAPFLPCPGLRIFRSCTSQRSFPRRSSRRAGII